MCEHKHPHAVPTQAIRLGCIFCDRNDYDGVDTLPDDWTEVSEVRSLQESMREVVLDGIFTSRVGIADSVLDWETHLGVCPECGEKEE